MKFTSPVITLCALLVIFALASARAAPTGDREGTASHPRMRRGTIAVLGDFTTNNITVHNSDWISMTQCLDLKTEGYTTSGLYRVDPCDGKGEFTVYCDMTLDEGGWTVIQRRLDGSVDFNRTWFQYKTGFGNLNGEFWLGLEKIRRLVTHNPGLNYELYIGLGDYESPEDYRAARYESFSIEAESLKYKLTIGQFQSGAGTAGDSLVTDHDTMSFSTWDSDNDLDNAKNCAHKYGGGWWFNKCLDSNLNGIHYPTYENPQPLFGIIWESWQGQYYSMKEVVMAIRPV